MVTTSDVIVPYNNFLLKKIVKAPKTGFDVSPDDLNPNLYDWQKEVSKWTIKTGNVLGALAVGLGKTILQVEWAKQIQARAGGKVLFICPLAVAHQTISEARKLSNVDIAYCRNQSEADEATTPFIITNQELVLNDHFDPGAFSVLVLDEASKMLKAFRGKTRQKLTYEWNIVPHRSAWTATPAPNRLHELLYYAEFLGVMNSGEALTRWFIRDTQHANKLRLKKPAENEFWDWLTSWCIMMSRPSDIGYSDTGYDLPRLNIEEVIVKVDQSRAFSQVNGDGQARMFLDASLSATDMWQEKRETNEDRARAVAAKVAQQPDANWLIFCDTNYEEQALAKALPGAVVVTGSQPVEVKEERLSAFVSGEIRQLITKTSIAGFGLNCQYVCNNMAFAGLTHKWEQVHQGMGRIYRFGQDKQCNVFLVYAESEANIIETLEEKQKQYQEMQQYANAAMARNGLGGSRVKHEIATHVVRKRETGRNWEMSLGDSVDFLVEMPDNHIHLGVSSWPFSDQYMYSAHVADFGNCDSDKAFFRQMDYLLPELYRVTIPGRLQVVHAKDRIVYGSKNNGYFEIEPFSDDCIRAMRRHGFLFVGRITIHTDVVRENNQTNRLGYGRLCKDATTVHVGSPEYLLLFRKPHTQTAKGGMWSDIRVELSPDDYSLARHQVDSASTWRTNGKSLPYPFETPYEYEAHIAHLERLDRRGELSRTNETPLWSEAPQNGVWGDIQRTCVLNGKLAKGNSDERHICPLQLDLIRRCILRWSMPCELVLDYFAGIGSVPYVAVQENRQGVGCDLKEEYFEWAVKYLKEVELEKSQVDMFSLLETA